MKTHEVSKYLKQVTATGRHSSDTLDAIKQLAALLDDGPNINVSEARLTRRTDEVAGGLKGLLSLSKYSKQQWLELAQDHGMTLQHNPRDSARDVLGKVLRYLEAHPEVVKVLGASRTRRTKVDVSELENALTKLLERKDG